MTELFRAAGRLVKLSFRAGFLGLELFHGFVTGSLTREDIEELGELWLDVGASYDDVSILLAAGVTAQVAIAYGMLVVALETGAITIPLADTVFRLARRINAELEPLYRRLDELEARAGVVLNQEHIQASLRAAQASHRVGLIVSKEYRGLIGNFYGATQQLSQAVFGNATTVNSALGLLQLATQDASRLAGNEVDLGNTRFFGEAQRLASRIEAKNRQYQRRPGDFWAEFLEGWIKPLQEESFAEASANRQRVDTVVRGLATARTEAERIDSRFRTYRDKLEPFLSDESIGELNQIRISFHRTVTLPLERLDRLASASFPALQADVVELDGTLASVNGRLDEVEVLTDNPLDLGPRNVSRQRVRESEKSNSALTYQAPVPDALVEVRSRLEAILREIRAE